MKRKVVEEGKGKNEIDIDYRVDEKKGRKRGEVKARSGRLDPFEPP